MTQHSHAARDARETLRQDHLYARTPEETLARVLAEVMHVRAVVARIDQRLSAVENAPLLAPPAVAGASRPSVMGRSLAPASKAALAIAAWEFITQWVLPIIRAHV